LVFTPFLVDIQHKKGWCEDRLANLLVVSLGKALNGIASPTLLRDGGMNELH